jgi:hypothetical protein
MHKAKSGPRRVGIGHSEWLGRQGDPQGSEAIQVLSAGSWEPSAWNLEP